MTATTRSARAEQTRRTVLLTAQRLFGQHGYDATSLQMIADEMGVTKAAVYYYFRTKAGILHALALEPVAQTRAALKGVARRGSRDDRIRKIVQAWVELVVNTRGITSLRLNDPGVQRELQLADEFEMLAQQGLWRIFGTTPSSEQYLAYYLLLNMRDVAARMPQFTDDQLRAAMTLVGNRIMDLDGRHGNPAPCTTEDGGTGDGATGDGATGDGSNENCGNEDAAGAVSPGEG